MTPRFGSRLRTPKVFARHSPLARASKLRASFEQALRTAVIRFRRGYRRDKATAATTNRCRSEFLSTLKPVEIRRAVKCSSGFDVAIKHRVSHTENSSHHRFGSFVPNVTVIFDNAGIDFHVPVRHVHVEVQLRRIETLTVGDWTTTSVVSTMDRFRGNILLVFTSRAWSATISSSRMR